MTQETRDEVEGLLRLLITVVMVNMSLTATAVKSCIHAMTEGIGFIGSAGSQKERKRSCGSKKEADAWLRSFSKDGSNGWFGFHMNWLHLFHLFLISSGPRGMRGDEDIFSFGGALS